MRNGLKAFSKVFLSNFLVMLLGIFTTLIIPKYLGPSSFGQYQVYIFYSSYLGLFLLGYCDGLYLRYGGKEYKELDQQLFSKYFNFLVLYTLSISFILFSILNILGDSAQFHSLYILLSITLIFQGLNSFFVLINQASGRFTVYSITNIIEKLILALFTLYIFMKKSIKLEELYTVVVLSKFVVLVINMIFDWNIIFKVKIFNLFPSKKNIYESIRAGLPLTISGVVSMLITGIGRNTVQLKLGYQQFGYYSLVFSLMSIITQVISAVSIVFYPLLKKTKLDKMKTNLKVSEKIFLYIGIIINFSFFFIYVVLVQYLPQYLPASKSLVLLIPTLIYQARISILYNTYYKVLRKEKTILMNGVIAFIFCFFLSNIMFSFFPYIETMAFATLISFAFWGEISRVSLFKYFNIKSRSSSIGIMFSSIFIITTIYFHITLSLVIYTLVTGVYFMKKKKDIKFIMQQLKLQFR